MSFFELEMMGKPTGYILTVSCTYHNKIRLNKGKKGSVDISLHLIYDKTFTIFTNRVL